MRGQFSHLLSFPKRVGLQKGHPKRRQATIFSDATTSRIKHTLIAFNKRQKTVYGLPSNKEVSQKTKNDESKSMSTKKRVTNGALRIAACKLTSLAVAMG